jgi:scyllo-inositol 2-dehydrogenase (NADP+)
LRVIVVGLGVQGYKRREHAGDDYVASVDPVNGDADYRDISEVPLNAFDAVLACVPDDPKIELLTYCLKNKKHVLVEKPFWAKEDQLILDVERLARANGVVCYTAYNHRFEPHFVRMHELINSGELGAVYSCRMFYGNGTARLVRDSAWRDKGDGVLPDLGSHLLDTCRYWFGDELADFQLISAHRFENKAPDHVVIGAMQQLPMIELEMTLCMWRNHFSCDILGENGSAHIESLCKWGPSTFTHRQRVIPSGRPPEIATTLVQADPTWTAEYSAFKALIESGTSTDLKTDYWLQQQLRALGKEIAT